MAQFKYRRVSLRTKKGIQTAERLKKNGWREQSHSPDVIVFEKRK